MSKPEQLYTYRLVCGSASGAPDYVQAGSFWLSQQEAIDAALRFHARLGGVGDVQVVVHDEDPPHVVAAFPRTARDGGLPHDWTETWGYAFYRRVVGFARRFQLWASSL